MTIRYATAQLITTVAREHESYVFFVAQDGIPPEFALSLQPGQIVRGATRAANRGDGQVTIRPSAGTGAAFTIGSASGKPTHFVVLTQEQAERLTVLEIDGRKTLIYSGAYAFSDGESLHLRSDGRSNIFFGALSAENDAAWQSAAGLQPQTPEGVFPVYEAAISPKKISVELTEIKEAGVAPLIERANPAGWRKQPVAVAPTDATLQKFAASWNITVPKDALAEAEDVFLQIRYQGDVGRLYSGETLLDDNFCNGTPWILGLKRFAGRLDAPFRLEVLPLRDDAPVYFDAGYRPQFTGKQLAGLPSITAVAEYEVVVHRRQSYLPR